MTQTDTDFLTEEINERDRQILQLISQGLSNRAIARKLILATETVKWYNKQLYAKLGVNSRTQAVHRARRLGLLERTPAALPRPKTPPHNLPAGASTFVGRKNEIARIKHLLQTHRLVTLTGPGGSGKSRLALETTRFLLPLFKDGAWLVELAGVHTPAQAKKHLAGILKLNPRTENQTGAAVKSYLANKRLLLVADNLEHLLDFTPFLAELLAESPHLRILATSRERLNLSGEQEFQVAPLHTPDPDAEDDPDRLKAFEAVDLFLQRARAVDLDFDPAPEKVRTIARICRRLDGLPLAIELAAARVRLYNPAQLLHRLDNRLGLLTAGPRDAPARQRTLRGAIAWSYDLLGEGERLLFARLGSFRGGVTLDAVEKVCRIDRSEDALASLLAKNLLYRAEDLSGEPRLAMLETVHEFARETLGLLGEENDLRDRQLAYYLELVGSMSEGYRYREHARLLQYTLAEMPNLRAAFEWALETGRHEQAARMVSAMDYFFRYLHLLAEGFDWVKQVLNVSETLRPAVQAPFLLSAGRLAMHIGDLALGRRLGERGLELANELGDQNLIAWLKFVISCACDFPAERDEAFRLAEAGLAFFRETGEKSGIANGLNLLGEFYRLEGNYQEAEAVYDEALEVTLETGETLRQSFVYANLSMLAYHRGDQLLAKELCEQGIRMRLDVGQFFYACTGLAFLAGPLHRLGNPGKAARLLGASDTIQAQYGVEYQHTDLPEVERIKTAVRDDMGEKAFDQAYREGIEMSPYEAVDYALDDSR